MVKYFINSFVLLCCKVIRSRNDLKLKVRNFLMYEENTNTIAIPIYTVLLYCVIPKCMITLEKDKTKLYSNLSNTNHYLGWDLNP